MKIMIVNYQIKHKFKAMLVVIKNLVFDYILYFVTAYMRKYSIHVTGQSRVQNIIYITWRSKLKKNKKLGQTIYNSNHTHTKSLKLLQWKIIESPYVNQHCLLLYALKVWNYSNSLRRRRLHFFHLSYFLSRSDV